MKKVALLLSYEGEEDKTINTIDIWRCLQMNISILSCGSTKHLISYHHAEAKSDNLLGNQIAKSFNAAVLVGGTAEYPKVRTKLF